MQIITGINIFDKNFDNSIVTIGNFDGVHRGHAEIFSHIRQKSIALGIPSVIVTFEPHPLKVLAPESAPFMITTFDQKTALIDKFGIDSLVVVPFSLDFSQCSANDFVIDLLCGSLGMRHITIGHDYAFGRNREGTFETLEHLSTKYGFSLEDIPPIGDGGIVFSSSLVRSAVIAGDMPTASNILGRYYQISGTVVHGREFGKTLGFPTANIKTLNELIPSDGVYAVMCQIDGEIVKGACNIGFNPTVGGNSRTIEVFLLDYIGDIYDHKIEVMFVEKLRSEQKFSDVLELKNAISLDVANVRVILKNMNISHTN